MGAAGSTSPCASLRLSAEAGRETGTVGSPQASSSASSGALGVGSEAAIGEAEGDSTGVREMRAPIADACEGRRVRRRVLGEVVEHGTCLVDDGSVFGVEAVDEPADEGDLAHELCSRKDVQVGGAALVAVGFAEAFEECVGCGGLDPRDVEGGVAHVRAGPTADGEE